MRALTIAVFAIDRTSLRQLGHSNQEQHTKHDAQFHRRGGEWTQAKQIFVI